jgi:hypothetical protein
MKIMRCLNVILGKYSGTAISTIVMCLMIILGHSKPGFSRTERDIDLLADRLERDVLKVVRANDYDAFVILKLEPKKLDVGLPMTPFTLKDANIASENIWDGVAKVSLTIYSNRIKDSANLRDALGQVVGASKLKLSISFAAMPLIPFSENESGGVGGQVGDNPAGSSAISIGDPVNRLSSTISSFLRDIDITAFESGIASMYSFVSYLVWAAFGIGVAILIGFLSFTYFGNLAVSRVEKSVSTGVARIVEAIDGGEGSGRTGAQRTESQNVAAATKSSNLSSIQNLSNESLAALIADCYWSQEDSYAAFIWSRLGFQEKSYLISNLPFMKEYAGYIVEKDQSDAGYDGHSYYLAPLPLNQVSSIDLSQMVESQPSLYGGVSPLRRKSLKLSITQQIRANEIFEAKVVDFQEILSKMIKGPSPFRDLPRQVNIIISSVEDELDILSNSNLSKSVLANIPSLIYLSQLPIDQIAHILKDFSARDLASAWIAPPIVLDALRSALPEKKRTLLDSYRESVVARRDSQTFVALVRKAAALKFGESQNLDPIREDSSLDKKASNNAA